MAQKRFHKHYDTPGVPLYWIIIAYIILGWFFPVIGLLAIICMIGPVVTSIYKGRWWCGHVCPMQLTPYDARGEAIGYLHPDCLKCGKCKQYDKQGDEMTNEREQSQTRLIYAE